MSEVNAVNNVNNNVYNVNADKKANSANGDFSSYLGESKTLDEIFSEASKKYNVSENLLKAIGKQESNFNEKAVSRCGAQGVMQLMPSTAASLGVTNSFDAEQNIMAGAKYISGLLDKYDGNASLALAAYNAGSGNVAKYNGIPPFKETQNYVKKVMGYMNQGVDTNNATVSVGGTTSGANTNNSNLPNIAQIKNNLINMDNNTEEDTSNSLEDVFNYDDYLNFLDKFLNDDSEDDKSKSETSYYASQSISYSAPVISLLKMKANQ
jgi:hypothetical protein